MAANTTTTARRTGIAPAAIGSPYWLIVMEVKAAGGSIRFNGDGDRRVDIVGDVTGERGRAFVARLAAAEAA
jgi:hypothetical protein